MSYADPRGAEHYRLYEIPSHVFVPPFVSAPQSENGNKGKRNGMEAEGAKTQQNRAKVKVGTANLFLKQLPPG